MRNRTKQREVRRKFGKEDRIDLKMIDGKLKDPTAYFAMKNLTRSKGEEARYL